MGVFHRHKIGFSIWLFMSSTFALGGRNYTPASTAIKLDKQLETWTDNWRFVAEKEVYVRKKYPVEMF